jgi:chromosome segregation ATPase
VAALQKKIESTDRDKAEEERKLGIVVARINELKAELLAITRKGLKTKQEMAKLDAQIDALSDEDKAKLKVLHDLQTRSEALKQQVEQFKDSCRRHLADLQERIRELESEAASGEGARRLAELRAQHEDAAARLDKAKALLSAQNREVDRLQRLLDDIPSRAELLQYERRFAELYDEVAAKLDETRRYFALYNTITKKKEFMVKEEELITSMITNFSALKVRCNSCVLMNTFSFAPLSFFHPPFVFITSLSTCRASPPASPTSISARASLQPSRTF